MSHQADQSSRGLEGVTYSQTALETGSFWAKKAFRFACKQANLSARVRYVLKVHGMQVLDSIGM